MEAIHTGFQEGGVLFKLLNDSSPFRQTKMHGSILGRSWAIHDGILGHPFQNITMYKRVGYHAKINTFPDAVW
jgi:acetoin utilization protein AcuC